ncbi:MAG TPA: GNAT family N-acetyltransferase [Chitinophagaceae bacterium]|nr:GNAT family N-acetyltransferase [Chitinophagaceae bacterium]
MEIKNRVIKQTGKFYVEEEGEIKAELIYKFPSSPIMIIEHTEVNESLKGKNVGFQLVKRAVEYARENHLKIIPFCPYAKSVFEREKDFGDVLK